MLKLVWDFIAGLLGLNKTSSQPVEAPQEKKKKELEAEVKIIRKEIKENREKSVTDEEIEKLFNGDKK